MADNDDIGYDEEAESTGFFKWLQIGVVLFAVAGFFALAWYAYNSTDTIDEKNVEVIHAEKTPVKEAPANPGGMQIPNQDKAVYSLITNNKNEKTVAERILPATEEPVNRENDAETWVSDKVKNNAPASDAPSKKLVVITPPPQPVAAPIVNNSIKDTQPANAGVKTDDTAKTEQFNPTKTVIAKPEQSSEKTEDAPKKKSAVSKPTAFRAQLGAYRSEADAGKDLKRIAHKFANSMQDKKSIIIKVVIAGKGTFYRLQVFPFQSASDVSTFCDNLTSQDQGCLMAKK